MATNISDTDFAKEVLEEKSKMVLIDFWAEWCGPCRQLSPILDAISEEMKDKIKVVKLNIDDNPNTPTTYGVRGIPTMMLFKQGKLVDTKVGALPRNIIETWINDNIASSK